MLIMCWALDPENIRGKFDAEVRKRSQPSCGVSLGRSRALIDVELVVPNAFSRLEAE